MIDPVDTIEKNGLFRLDEIEYKGNFTIKYFSKAELDMLQAFFGVRRLGFDMKLLESRPTLLSELQGFQYEKDTNS